MGIAAVPLALPVWLQRDPQLEEQLRTFAQSRSLDVSFYRERSMDSLSGPFHFICPEMSVCSLFFVWEQILFLMGMFHGDLTDFQRQLGIYVPGADQSLMKDVQDHLATLDVHASPLEASTPSLPLYNIDKKYSRKQLSPLLSEFLKKR